MENKKNEDKRIERRIPLHFLIGLNIALLLTLVAFEWKPEVAPVDLDYDPITGEEWDEQPIFRKIVVPPQPKPTVPEYVETKDDVVESDDPIVEIDEPIIDNTDVENLDSLFTGLAPIVDEKPDDAPFEIVEEMPSYPGGWGEFNKFISKHIKYPRQAKALGIEGTVFVQFIIERDGSISDLKVIKGVKGGINEESIRVMNLVPEFIPGKQRGVPVRVKKILPIKFKLQ